MGLPLAGTVQDVSAMPMLRELSLTRRARSASSDRLRPCSAAAPTIFSTAMAAPVPRRPAVKRLSSTATSSFITTASTVVSVSAAASSAAMSKFMTSPV